MTASEGKDMGVNSGDLVESAAPSTMTNGQDVVTNKEGSESKAKGKAKGGSKEPVKSAEETKDGKLSGAELKKRAKEEKAARRAKEKQAQQPLDSKKGDTGKGAGGQDTSSTMQISKNQHKKTGSIAANQQKPMALRPAEFHAAAPPQEVKKEKKKVGLFGHLYGTPRRSTIAGAGKDVHPAVLALGLQMSSYVICGSNARCVATLLVFKRVGEPRELG